MKPETFWKLLLSLVTVIIMIFQIRMAKEQNRLARTQNYLTTTLREGSYSSEYDYLIKQINEETKCASIRYDSIKDSRSWKDFFSNKLDILNVNPDTLKMELSPSLRNNIIAFSQNAIPYNTLDENGDFTA